MHYKIMMNEQMTYQECVKKLDGFVQDDGILRGLVFVQNTVIGIPQEVSVLVFSDEGLTHFFGYPVEDTKIDNNCFKYIDQEPMTLYSQLKKAIEHGLMPITKDDDGEYIVWTSIMEDGSIRCSYIKNSVEECLESLGVVPRPENTINAFESHSNAHIIGYHQPKIIPYEVGELVDVLESAKECWDYVEWNEAAKFMVGKKRVEIKSVWNNPRGLHYNVWNRDKTDYWTFRHAHVAPHFPESEPETIEMTLEEVATKLKIDVKKLRIKE